MALQPIMPHPRNGKYSCIELERRFLVRALPPNIVAGSYRWRIVDRYIEGTRLRLRRMESAAGDRIQRKLTQKFSESAEPTVQTIITNIYLNEAEYRVLEALGGSEILKFVTWSTFKIINLVLMYLVGDTKA